jgi:hypothetical protein
MQTHDRTVLSESSAPVGLASMLLLALVGCATTVTKGEHSVTLSAPEKVNRGEEFIFRVFVKDSAGQEQIKAVYHWSIDWEGLEGMKHKGKSGLAEHIRVKGSPGTAVLHILGVDAAGEFVELARHSFKVE